MTGISEDALRKAKSSQSSLLARDWNRDTIEEYINYKQILLECLYTPLIEFKTTACEELLAEMAK